MRVMAGLFRLAFFVLPSAFAATSPPTAPPTPACNWQCYLDNNPDLASTVGATNTAAAQSHYEHTGQTEGRVCTCLDSTSPLKASCAPDESSRRRFARNGCTKQRSFGSCVEGFNFFSSEVRQTCQTTCSAEIGCTAGAWAYENCVHGQPAYGTYCWAFSAYRECPVDRSSAYHEVLAESGPHAQYNKYQELLTSERCTAQADNGDYGGSYGGTNTSDDFCESLVNEYPESCNSESFRRECEQSCTAALTDGLLSAANQQLVHAVGALAAFFQIVISLRLE